MKNTNQAASAFGLPTSKVNAGMPKAENVGGYRGYSTEKLFNNSMSGVPANVKKMLNNAFSGQNKKGGGGK